MNPSDSPVPGDTGVAGVTGEAGGGEPAGDPVNDKRGDGMNAKSERQTASEAFMHNNLLCCLGEAFQFSEVGPEFLSTLPLSLLYKAYPVGLCTALRLTKSTCSSDLEFRAA